MEGDAETGSGKHREVVGPVANGYGLGNVDVLKLGNQSEQLGFAGSVDDVANEFAG